MTEVLLTFMERWTERFGESAPCEQATDAGPVFLSEGEAPPTPTTECARIAVGSSTVLVNPAKGIKALAGCSREATAEEAIAHLRSAGAVLADNL